MISASTNLRLIKFNSSIFFSNDSSSFTRFSKDKKADIDKFSSFLNFGKTSDCNVETSDGSALGSRILIFNFLSFFRAFEDDSDVASVPSYGVLITILRPERIFVIFY